MERRHSTTSDSSDSSHTRQSSGENVDGLVGRVSKVTSPKPAANPLQFVKTGPCELYRSAQEQIKKVEEIKKAKKLVKEEAEEWQSNLDNWKCSRRKRQEHIIERVVEVKKYELEEFDRNKRRNKTFSEMMQDRNIRGRKTSLPVYLNDDANDFSELGIGNGDKNMHHDTSSISTDSDHERDISLEQNSVSEEDEKSNKYQIEQNGEKTPVNDSKDDAEEYTYERAIQSYVNFTESRVKGRTAAKPPTSEKSKPLTNGYFRESPPVPAKPRRSSASARMENSVAKKPADMPKVDISKKKEMFEKIAHAEDGSKKSNRSDLPAAKTIKERLSSLKEQAEVAKVQLASQLPPDVSVKDRLSDIEKMKSGPEEAPIRRSSEQLTTQTIKERLSNLEKVKNAPVKSQTTVEPTVTIKERLTSLQSACNKEPQRASSQNNVEQYSRQEDECYENDGYDRAFSPEDLYTAKRPEHYRHRSLDSLDIDNDGASNDTFERVQSLEDFDYCRYPASSLSGDTDREDSGIHTADVSSCVSQADDYDLHMESTNDDIKLHHQPTIVEEINKTQLDASDTSSSSCPFAFEDSMNDTCTVSGGQETPVPAADESSNPNNRVSSLIKLDALPIILESPSESFSNPLNKVEVTAIVASSPLPSEFEDGQALNDETSVCNIDMPSSNCLASSDAPLSAGDTNIAICSSVVNEWHVDPNERSIEDVEAGLNHNMGSTEFMSSVISKNSLDDSSLCNSQKLDNSHEINSEDCEKDGKLREDIEAGYTEKEIDKANSYEHKFQPALNDINSHVDSFKVQKGIANSQLLTSKNQFENNGPVEGKLLLPEFIKGDNLQPGELFINLNMDQEVESVFQMSPSALEPPKEKPPPPPTDLSDDEVDPSRTKKPSSLRRLDSTKRIKKEIRQKRSSFLGIEGNNDDSYLDPELELIRPPDMTTLLAEERRMERQLYRQSVCSESDSNQESRDSGVELDNKTQDIAWNHSRNDSEIYGNQSTTSEEDEIMRKEREIIETLEQEERIRKQDLGEKLALRLRQLEVEKGRDEWERVHSEDELRCPQGKITPENNHVEDIEAFTVNRNIDPSQMEPLDLYNHQDRLEAREPIEHSQMIDSVQPAWYDTRSSLQDICHQAENQACLRPHETIDYSREYRSSMQDLTQSGHALQPPVNRQPMVSHGRSMPNLQEVLPRRPPPPPPPPLLPAKPRLQPNNFPEIASCPQQMSRQTLHALSAAPRSRIVGNDTWQVKRKPRQENYNYQHWLIQEAEHRRITEQQERQCVGPPPRGKQGIWGGHPHYPVHPHHPPPPPPPPAAHHWTPHRDPRDTKPLPDSVIQTITQRIQNRMNNSDTNNNRRRYESNYNSNDHHQEKMLSVSGKKRCSHCGEELGVKFSCV